MTKNRVLQIRLTEDEYNRLAGEAKNANRTISDYARTLISVAPPAPNPPQQPVPTTTRTAGDAFISAEQRLAEIRTKQTREFRPYTKAEQAGRKKP